MKKLLLQADRLIIASGIAGLLLRLWLYFVGPNERGLYPKYHISWILLLILSAAVAVILFLMSGHAGYSRNYGDNFRASGSAAVGCILAAVCMALYALSSLQKAGGKSGISLLGCGFGIAAAVALVVLAGCRRKGTRPHYGIFAILSLHYGLYVFLLGRTWGDDPELLRFLFGFFASVSAMLASYQMWGFSVDLGNRSASLFWSLLAIFLNFCAIGENLAPLFHAGTAIWLLTNLCPLNPPPRFVFNRAEKAELSQQETVPEDIDTVLDDRELQELLYSDDAETPGEEMP